MLKKLYGPNERQKNFKNLFMKKSEYKMKIIIKLILNSKNSENKLKITNRKK